MIRLSIFGGAAADRLGLGEFRLDRDGDWENPVVVASLL
jgi:hypothetical protein